MAETTSPYLVTGSVETNYLEGRYSVIKLFVQNVSNVQSSNVSSVASANDPLDSNPVDLSSPPTLTIRYPDVTNHTPAVTHGSTGFYYVGFTPVQSGLHVFTWYDVSSHGLFNGEFYIRQTAA